MVWIVYKHKIIMVWFKIELQKISLISIWESSHQKIQSIITKKLYEQKFINLDDTISNGISNQVITSNRNNDEGEDRARITSNYPYVK